MAHPGDEQRLLSEALLGAGIVLTQWRTEDLHGSEAAEVAVLREVAGPHAPASETAQHAVPPGEQLPDPVAGQARASAVLVHALSRLQDDVAHHALKGEDHGPLHLIPPTRIPFGPCPGRSTPPWHRTSWRPRRMACVRTTVRPKS